MIGNQDFTQNAPGRQICPHCHRYGMKEESASTTTFIHKRRDGTALGSLVTWGAQDLCSLDHATKIWREERPEP